MDFIFVFWSPVIICLPLKHEIVMHHVKTLVRGGLFRFWHTGPKLKICQMPIEGSFVLTLCIFLLYKKSQGLFVNWIGREGVHDKEEPST